MNTIQIFFTLLHLQCTFGTVQEARLPKMLFIRYKIILPLLHSSAQFTHSVENNVWDNLLSGIKKDEDPYQVTMFINSRENMNVYQKLDTVIRRSIQEVPAVMIDINKISSARDNRSLSLTVLHNPRHVSLHVVLYYFGNDDKHTD